MSPPKGGIKKGGEKRDRTSSVHLQVKGIGRAGMENLERLKVC